jgi:hypothetical protein
VLLNDHRKSERLEESLRGPFWADESCASLSADDFDRRSLCLLFTPLGNSALEPTRLFLEQLRSLPFGLDSISLLSVEALDAVLSEWSVDVGSEEAIPEIFLSRGSDYSPLLRHIHCGRMNFGPLSWSQTAISAEPL